MTSRTFLFALVSCTSLGAVACSGRDASESPADAGTSVDATPSPTGDGSSPIDAGAPLDESPEARSAASAAALAPAVAANNAFALSLYGQVAPTVDGGNLMTSPLSASLALTMTYAGAQGQTATEMASALQLPATASSIFDGQNALSQALAGRAAAALAWDQTNAQNIGEPAPNPSDYALQVVNSVWGEKTYPWAAPFLGILASDYGTGVYLEDFVNDSAAAVPTINAWVSAETADKINNLIPATAIDSSTRMVLVNAIHLKLPWQSPFAPAQTANGTFTRGDGTQVTASFMNQTLSDGLAGYVETADAQVVSLPLSDDQLTVFIAMPKNGLPSLVSSLTPATWSALTATTFGQNVILSLPKFTFTSPSFSLATALKALGMTTAFNAQAADFKGLCAAPPDGDNLYISDVLQKATMAVAENGVEAAAATAVLVAGAAEETQSVTVTINQPFLVSVVDSSGAIVFLGQIDDPTNTGSP